MQWKYNSQVGIVNSLWEKYFHSNRSLNKLCIINHRIFSGKFYLWPPSPIDQSAWQWWRLYPSVCSQIPSWKKSSWWSQGTCRGNSARAKCTENSRNAPWRHRWRLLLFLHASSHREGAAGPWHHPENKPSPHQQHAPNSWTQTEAK